MEHERDRLFEQRSLERMIWAIIRGGLQLIIAGVMIFAAISAARYLVATKPQLDRKAEAEPTYSVEAVSASVEMIQPRFEVFGVVEARNSVELRSLVAGEIVEVHPDLSVGGRIEKGATLIRIDRFSYRGALVEAEANLAEAKAQLLENETRLSNERSALKRAEEQFELARRDLERAQDLARRGSGTLQSVDNRRLTFSQRQQAQEAAANAIAARQAQIDQLKASLKRLDWRVQQAKRNLRDTELRAPFDTIIRSEAVEIGRLLGINDVVATLYEADALDISFTVSDRRFGRLQSDSAGVLGRQVKLSWAIGDEPIKATAIIDRIGSDVSATRGGVELIGRINMKQGDATRLKPGAVITVSMPDRAYPNAARLPETALFNSAYVFTIKTDTGGAERLRRRSVSALAWDGTDVIVRPLEDGWLDGARIMTTRLAEAGDGVRVKILNMQASSSKKKEAHLQTESRTE